MFAGLCAFPLAAMDGCGIGEAGFVGLVAGLAQAGVDSIGALGDDITAR
jgi:4-hydroxy-tetrahydrodipicolinate synthase